MADVGYVANRENVETGAGRMIVADFSVTSPRSFEDIFEEDGVTLKTGFRDIGATDGWMWVETSTESTDIEVDQVVGALDTINSSRNMSISTNLAEATFENLQIAWGIVGDIAIANGLKTFKIGNDLNNPSKRVIIITSKYNSSDSKRRAYVVNKAKWDGSSSAMEFKKWEKTLIPLTMKVYADTSLPSDEQIMVGFEEQ